VGLPGGKNDKITANNPKVEKAARGFTCGKKV
jgi:hypothetical protein